ncbi:MAG TPA: peptidase domain-containing ABC transporter [Chthoniobacterales bacterium]|nr:peptidase domain-containing ABC transporter [Chthoniobacterales bacterium]
MSLTDQLQRLGKRNYLPMFLQTEAAECGAVCLAMVANYHGHKLDLSAMRRRFPVSSIKGTTLAGLINISHRLGFNPRPLRVEPEYLPQLQTPCILHWDMNHFVVLKQVTARKIVLHDPARGLVRLSHEEVSNHFTGVVLELDPIHDFQPIHDRRSVSIRSVTGRIVGLKRSLIRILLLSLSLEVFVLVSPFFLQGVIDQVLISGNRQLLTVLCAGFLIVVLFQGAVTGLRGWLLTWISARINAQWKTNLFHHLLGLPMDYFEKRHMGDVLSRFGSIEVIQHTLTTSFVTAMLDGITGLLVLVLLAAYSLPLTGLVLLVFGIYALLRWLSSHQLRNAQAEQIHQAAHQQTSLMESVRGIQTIKLANAQPERVTRFANMTVEVAHRDIIIQRIGITFEALNHFLFGTQRVVIIWLGALSVLNQQFSAGMLVAYIAYAELFTGRGRSLIDKWIEFRLLRLQAERIADIALTPPESQLEVGYSGPLPQTALEVDNLSFRYAESEPWILKSCSLRIEPGESVALVGASGCGKTTLAKLMLGLLQPQEGTVRIGGMDIRKYGLEAYRNLFGVVMQEDQLFSGSITDNITFFDPAPDLARAQLAARQAAVHEEILSMPMAYDTLIGDMGSALSGGQKQRLLLARALYREPKFLLLDEATSHLDIFNEERVNAAIRDLQITRIVIAHRPETIVSADQIFTLQNGYIRSCTNVEYIDASRAESMIRFHHAAVKEKQSK